MAQHEKIICTWVYNKTDLCVSLFNIEQLRLTVGPGDGPRENGSLCVRKPKKFKRMCTLKAKK